MTHSEQWHCLPHHQLSLNYSVLCAVQMENNGNRDGMEARVKLCQKEGSVCPPLAWTMSNHLATFAPYQLRWYYQ